MPTGRPAHGREVLQPAVEVETPQLVKKSVDYVSAYVRKTMAIFFAQGVWRLQPDQEDPISEPLHGSSASHDRLVLSQTSSAVQQARRFRPRPGLSEYVALERSGPEVDDAQHIHNKAVFDGVNEALTMLLPPAGREPVTGAQRRLRRDREGGERWRQAMTEEVCKLVCAWAAPKDVDNFDALLVDDIPQVRVGAEKTLTG